MIYHLTNDLKNVINDEMPQFEVEDITGRGSVLQVNSLPFMCVCYVGNCVFKHTGRDTLYVQV